MLSHYKQWLNDFRGAQYLEAEQLFLVTGTYMTHNWEAATFQKDGNVSIGLDVKVDAVFLRGNMSIHWQTWRNGERGFRNGHKHTGRVYPNPNMVPSFVACCGTCPEPPENQCIFLRGWRVKEPHFVRSRLAHSASVESTEGDGLSVKRGLSLFGRPTSANSRESSVQHPVANLVEAEGTPIRTGCVSFLDCKLHF
jgi:hypothetical protein